MSGEFERMAGENSKEFYATKHALTLHCSASNAFWV